MTDYTFPPDPQEVIGRQWSKTQSPERKRILGLARDALLFISATGQRHRFEKFRASLASGASPRALEQHPDDFASLKERLNKTAEFFTQLRDEPESVSERALIQVILDTLHFISSTEQHSAFEEYLKHVEAGGPPYVIAAFNTKAEAEAWLKKCPQPPDTASVLIADRHCWVLHDPYKKTFHLRHSHAIEYYLAELKREEPPNAIMSFASREEAGAWLQSQPTPARWAWVSIAGEFYLAAYYANINHRALYPLSMADGYEVEPEEPTSK